MDKPAASAAAAGGGAARNDKPVSLVVDDAPVAQVLQALAEMNHKNLVVAPDVSGTLSCICRRFPGARRCGRWRIARALFATAGDGHLRAYSGLAKGKSGAA
jgi:hypothetical protein